MMVSTEQIKKWSKFVRMESEKALTYPEKYGILKAHVELLEDYPEEMTKIALKKLKEVK